MALLMACGGFTQVEKSASLTVVNLSDLTICDVYFTRPTASAPSPSWLRQGERLEPEQSHTFAVAAGRWHLRMDDCGGRPLYARQLRVHGSQRLEFRPVEVQRRPWVGARRFADRDTAPTRW